MGSWGAAEWAAFGAVGAFVVYVLLGIFGYVQIRQAKELRERQSRPYVVVDFEFRRFVIFLVIRNIGATAARNVVVKFDQPLQTTKVRESDINAIAAFKSPIPMLAPSRAIQVTFDIFPQRLKEGLPLSHGVTVTYQNDRGDAYADPHFVIDLAHHAEAAVGPKGMPELVSEVQELRRELHKWTQGIDGIHVYTTDLSKHVTRRDRPHDLDRARRLRESNGWLAYGRWWVNRWLRNTGWRY